MPAPETQRDPKTILIIDDDPHITLAMREILCRGGYEKVLSAQTSAAGIRILAEHGEEIAVLILDMRMPDMDGLTVVSHLLEVHMFPLATIMITAYGRAQKSAFLRFTSDTVFAAAYIEKPFDHDVFLAEVGDAMKRAQSLRRKGTGGTIEHIGPG